MVKFPREWAIIGLDAAWSVPTWLYKEGAKLEGSLGRTLDWGPVPDLLPHPHLLHKME